MINIYAALSDLLTRAKDFATSERRVKQKRNAHCEWLRSAPNVMLLIRQKKNLWRRHKVAIRSGTCRPEVLLRMRELSVTLNKIKMSAKADSYSDLFLNATDSKQVWRNINNVIRTGKKRNDECVSIKVNNQTVDDDSVAEAFANQFATAAQIVADQIPVRNGDSPNLLNTIKRYSIDWSIS